MVANYRKLNGAFLQKRLLFFGNGIYFEKWFISTEISKKNGPNLPN